MISKLKTLFSYDYNRKKPIEALIRLLKWKQAKNQNQKLKYTFWGNRSIYCYPDSTSSMWLIYSYFYDKKEFVFLSKYLKNTDTVFDIGANIGIYSLWMSKFVEDGKIIAFEPDPKNHQRCKEQLLVNNLQHIVLEDIALADQNGILEFSIGKDMENHLLLNIKESKALNSIEVKSQKMDDYCQEENISSLDFVKIDVEGAEKFVFEGANKLLTSQKIKCILLEVNQQQEKFDTGKKDVAAILREAGYSFYDYNYHKNKLIPLTNLPQDTHINILAIADIDYVRNRINT
ncbi:FkbM family methyltransferase [Bernardetia sp. ABR2-2B]|uniref:FkbM family methyltransferase n=1 Tax=Bernardetia sp. ABR2-2B TaxID=3127472 RepID=UPI0030D4C788